MVNLIDAAGTLWRASACSLRPMNKAVAPRKPACAPCKRHVPRGPIGRFAPAHTPGGSIGAACSACPLSGTANECCPHAGRQNQAMRAPDGPHDGRKKQYPTAHGYGAPIATSRTPAGKSPAKTTSLRPALLAPRSGVARGRGDGGAQAPAISKAIQHNDRRCPDALWLWRQLRGHDPCIRCAKGRAWHGLLRSAAKPNRFDRCNGAPELRRIQRCTLGDAGFQQRAARELMQPVLAQCLGDLLPRGAIPGRPCRGLARHCARFP